MRNGEKTALWVDEWNVARNLSILFPDIYNLMQHQQKTIAELWSDEGGLSTLEDNDWEIQRVAEFFGTIELFGRLEEAEDEINWQGNATCRYKVSKAYKMLNYPSQQQEK